jgi:hypothetical protein
METTKSTSSYFLLVYTYFLEVGGEVGRGMRGKDMCKKIHILNPCASTFQGTEIV